MTEEEEKTLYQRARRILREAGLVFEESKYYNYNTLRSNDFLGYAELYLWHCNKESKSNDEIDIVVYKTLVELDARLGSTASEQLFKCVLYTSRFDIMKVRFDDSKHGLVKLGL